MAVRDCWSFDDSTNLTLLDIAADSGSPTISSAHRTGTQSLLVRGSSTPNRASFPVGTSFALGAVVGLAFAYYPGWVIGSFSDTTNQGYFVVAFYEGTTQHINLKVMSSGNIAVYNGATQIGITSTPPDIAQYTWSHWEVKMTCHDTTGSVEVRINGTSVLSLSNVDTRAGATGTIDHFMFANQGGSASIYNYIDDVVLWDDTGSDVTDFIGDKGVYFVQPNADGNYTDFTPLSGSNYENVDDADYDGDSTYNSSSTATDKDTFSNAGIAAGTVIAVQTVIRARKDDAGSRTLRPMFRRSSTDYPGTTVDLSDSYTRLVEMWHNDPSDSSDWTYDDIGASEFGYELVS